MFNIVIRVVLFIALSSFLQAKTLDLKICKSVNQASIISIQPEPSSTDVVPHTDIKINFNVELDRTRKKDISFKLKKIDKKKGFWFFKHFESIDGELSYIEDAKQLVFKPNKILEGGIYQVDVKHLKTTQKRMRKHLKHISFRFSVADTKVESLNIKPNPIELEVDSNISITTNITYLDGSSYEVDSDSCIVEDETIAKVDNLTLTAIKDGLTTLSCKYKNLTTKDTTITSYLIINGHRLPPMPDETLNNSTLLGIDVNNNGVRDDVERKVYFTYDKKVDQLLMMQSLKTHQKMLADPELIKNAYEWEAPENKNFGCRYYLFDKYDIPLDSDYTKFMNDNTYNTKDRIKKYMKYNQALSGGVFGTPLSDEVESSCDFNVTRALGL